MLVSVYQSIDMLFDVLPVKFNDALSISALRNKQLFKKMDGESSHFQMVKFFAFQTPSYEERKDLGKSLSFFL
jgi:hypothetical protein